MTEKERKERDARRQERKDRDKNKPPSRKFDVIDAFDESMKLFGSGGKWCHLLRRAAVFLCTS